MAAAEVSRLSFAYRKSLILLAVLSLGACSSGDDGAPAADAGSNASTHSAATPPLVVPEKLAIVADWLHGSLSYVDLAAVVAGGPAALPW